MSPIQQSAVLDQNVTSTKKRSLSNDSLIPSSEHENDCLINKPKRPRITIPSTQDTNIGSRGKLSSCGSPNSYSSLFSRSTTDSEDAIPASLTAPSIKGFFFTPATLLQTELADSIVDFCCKTYFNTPGIDQVMLFDRFASSEASASGLPPILLSLLDTLSVVLSPLLPEETYSLIFPTTPTQARQAIINFYHAGQGISPHVDLLKRYGDGIVGVSFGSGCVMRFDRVRATGEGHGRNPRDRWDLYLPERSIIVLSDEARYDWTHGIEERVEDLVSHPEAGDGRWLRRGVRISITFRWMLPGADVVGEAIEDTVTLIEDVDTLPRAFS